MNTIVYMSFGTGSHVQEIEFSVSSAMRLLKRGSEGSRSDYQFVVYTDRPTEFAGLPIIVQHVSEELRGEWFGENGFILRAKCRVLIEALMNFGGKCALLDTDTFFLKSPHQLFDKIGPGRSVMYEYLGPICSWGPKIAEVLERETPQIGTGESWPLTPLSPDFNSGVIGVDASNTALLDGVLPLCDWFFRKTKAWISEEFAHSSCLSRGTQIGEAYRIIHHYYHPATKSAFRKVLPQYLAAAAERPLEEQAEWLYGRRPVEPLKWRLFIALNRVKARARKMGLFQKPIRQWRGRQPATVKHREN